MENLQIKKNYFEFFNGKSNVSKKEDNPKILLISRNNNKPRKINNK